MPIVICAWCQAPIGESPVAGSHGICSACAHVVQGLPNLSEDELDDLPYGAIVLSRQGTVLAYNQAEQDLSGREAGGVIGQNFFADVAPCTAVQGFQGEFMEFMDGREPLRTFRFTFPFPTATVRVLITMLRRGEDALVMVRKAQDPEL